MAEKHIIIESEQVIYHVSEIPSVEQIVQSLQSWNNICKSIEADFKKHFDFHDVSIQLNINQIITGSLIEDFCIALSFKSRQQYEQMLSKIGDLPMVSKIIIALIAGGIGYAIDHFTNNSVDNSIHVENSTIILSDATLKTLYENTPGIAAISKSQNAPMTIFNSQYTAEQLKKIPDKYTNEPDYITRSFDDVSISVRKINFDDVTNWYGKIEDADGNSISSTKIEFADPSSVENIKNQIKSQNINFDADVDINFKKNKKGEYIPHLIIVKKVIDKTPE